MDQTKLKKALDNARWGKGENKLAQLLDQDPDFVSAFLSARLCRWVTNLTKTSPCKSVTGLANPAATR
jgi:hypothetical protein